MSTLLTKAATDRGIHPATLRRKLRELGLKAKRGKRSYVSDATLAEIDKNRRPDTLIDEEITVEQAADILWPEEARQLKRLRREGAKDYKKLRERHFSHVYHLIRQERLQILNLAHKRQVMYTARYEDQNISKKVVFETITVSKKKVYELKLEGIYPKVTELPPHWKTELEIARDRKIPLSKKRLARDGQPQVPGGTFHLRLQEIREEHGGIDPDTGIAKECFYYDKKDRARIELKYDTTRLYPILDKLPTKGNRWDSSRSAAEQRLLDVLDQLDPEHKGITRSRLKRPAKLNLRGVDRAFSTLSARGEVEKVPVFVPCGRKGSLQREREGIRRVFNNGENNGQRTGQRITKFNYPGHTLKDGRRGPGADKSRLEVMNAAYFESRVRGSEQMVVWTLLKNLYGDSYCKKPSKVRDLAREFTKKFKPPLPWKRDEAKAKFGHISQT
jgi:hypothetical protein